MKEKQLIIAARVISAIFAPFYLSLVGMVILFLFSYLSLLPIAYKFMVLLLVYVFTILLPTLLIHLYRRGRKWTLFHLGKKERRMVPYIISIASYFICCYIMEMLHTPFFMISILMAALVIQIICAMINVWWKISTHSAAIGGVTGALMAYSNIFMFNPTLWLCLSVIVAGLVGSSRMILRQHSLSQVVVGFLTGAVMAYLVVILL